MNKILLLCLIGLFIFNIHGQDLEVIDEEYFTDTTIGFIDEVHDYIKVENGIILSASIDTVWDDHPCILKIDLNGDVVWSTNNTNKTTANATNIFEIVLSDDGFIYGFSLDWPDYSQNNYIWKVDALTGEVIWRKLYFDTGFSWSVDILDYDSSMFVLGYLDELNGNYYPKTVLVDKISGDTIQTRVLYEESTHCNIIVDDAKNIYLAQNEFLHKFNKNNLNRRIWRRNYNTDLPADERMDCIKDIYLGRNKSIYLFGSEGNCHSSGNGIIIKIDEQTGDRIWKTIGCYGAVNKSDIAETDSTMFVSYKKGLTSQGSYIISKINKQSGVRSWLSVKSMTSLGQPQTYSGGVESALSLDINCNGDIYSTGFYGSPNFGPGAWGIMKIEESTGNKIYDLTITEDSTIYDKHSEGIISLVYGNTPVIIGEQGAYTGYSDDAYPVFTKLTQTGNVSLKRRIGGSYPYESSTVEIIPINDKILFLKQVGKSIEVEKKDDSLNSIWTTKINKPGVLFADQIEHDSSNIYVLSHVKDSSLYPPYHVNETSSLQLFKLDKSTGNILENDSILFNQANIVPFETEIQDSSFFVFFTQNDSIKYFKWENGTISSIEYLDNINTSIDYEESLNIIGKKGSDYLLAIGRENVFTIDKYNLTKNSILSFGSDTIFDHVLLSDTLALCGSSLAGKQKVSLYDLTQETLIWEHNTTNNGRFYKIELDSLNHIVAAGIHENHLNILRLNKNNGSIDWLNYLDTIAYPNTTISDLKINNKKSYVSISGSLNNNNSSDAIVYFIELNDNLTDSLVKLDELNGYSFCRQIEVLNSGKLVTGGAHNTTQNPLSGYISLIEIDACSYLEAPIYNDSNDLSTIQGMDSYQWYNCNNGLDFLGSNSVNFTPSQNGTYGVQVTEGMCTVNSNCETINNLSVDLYQTGEISIYPNPSSNTIQINSNYDIQKISFFSVTGELLEEFNASSKSKNIDISNYSEGVFIVRVFTRKGVFSKRIIKI